MTPAAPDGTSIDEEEVFLPPDQSALSRLPSRIQQGIQNLYEERLQSHRGTANKAIKMNKPPVMTSPEWRRRGYSIVTKPRTSLEIKLDEDVDFWEKERKKRELEEAHRMSKFNDRNSSPAPSIKSMKLQERAREWRADEARKSLEKKIDAERRGIPSQPWTSWPPPGYDKWGQPINKDGKDSWAFRNDSFQARKENEEHLAREKMTETKNSDEIVPMAHWQSEAARLGIPKGDLTTASQSAPDNPIEDSITSARPKNPSSDGTHKRTLGKSIKDRVRKLFGHSKRGPPKRGKISKDTQSYPSLKSVLQHSDPEISFTSSGSLLATKGTRHTLTPSISRSHNDSPTSNQKAKDSATTGMTFRGRVEQYG